jgi:hypothetical protein
MFFYCLSIIFICLQPIKTTKIIKNNSTLISILYALFCFAYYSSLLTVIYILSFEFFTSDGRIGKITSPIHQHHSTGYIIPVNYSQRETNQFHYSETSKSQKDSIKFLLLGETPYSNPERKIMDSRKLINYIPSGELKFENIEYNHEFSTEKTTFINVKTSSTFINITLGIRIYLVLLYLLIFLYFCKKIFFTLKENSTFPEAISPYLKKIGFLILGQEAILMSYYIMDSYIIDSLKLRPNLFRNFEYSPFFEFDIEIIILGLTLLLLSSIFKRGYEIESENELTI